VNVVLVTIDTLRADHCSAYGYARDTTPVMRRLASEGVLVEAAYAPMATTAPSHATLLTSLYPIAHGCVRNGRFLREQHVTLAERLKAAGYRTSAVVSSFVLSPRFGFGQGFGSFDSRFEDARPRDARQTTARKAFSRTADATTLVALDWLARRQRDRPFFLWVHYFDPHEPYAPPEAFRRRFRQTGPDEVAARYDGEVAFADEQLGRLLDALDQAGERTRTLVVLTADHGEGLGDHGHMTHSVNVYEEAVRVPLVFRWPGTVPAGRRLAGPVEMVDVTPTVLELLGLPLAPPLHGTSFAGALRGQPGTERTADAKMVFLQRRVYTDEASIRGEKFGVRAGSWKYIEALDEGTRELFDLRADPAELANVAARHPEPAARLSQAIARWRARHAGGPKALDDETEEAREGLRALGYVE
jgi:arylsulfatase A-like enzyme